MAEIDIPYRNLLEEIVNNGKLYEDPNRKGENRLEIPHYSFKYDLTKGFPAITTKKLAWQSVVAETLWILKGQTHIKYLHKDKCFIWDKDGLNEYR